MAKQNAQALFEKHEGEFLKFEQIPAAQRRHVRPDLCAMLYLHERFGGEDRDAIQSAEHDEIFLDWSIDKCRGLNEADAIYLTRCGVRLGEEGHFCMFV